MENRLELLELFGFVLKYRIFLLLHCSIFPLIFLYPELWIKLELFIISTFISIIIHESIHIISSNKSELRVSNFFIEVVSEKTDKKRLFVSTNAPVFTFLLGVLLYELTGEIWVSSPFILHLLLLPPELANFALNER